MRQNRHRELAAETRTAEAGDAAALFISPNILLFAQFDSPSPSPLPDLQLAEEMCSPPLKIAV